MSQLFRKLTVAIIISLFVGVSGIPAISVSEHNSILPDKKVISNDDQNFDRKINLLMKIGHIPSLSACIIKNNSVVWSKGYGEFDRENHKKASTDTIYYVASISKSITAVAIMQLYERGLFKLDDNVSKFLPFDLKNPRYPNVNITFRMLLAHQSSLADHGIEFLLYFSILGYPHEWFKEYFAPSGFIYNRQVWLDYPPGEKVYYSSVGYEILGYLVERISHQPFGQYCEEHIFKPLNMSNTSFYTSKIDKDRLAIPYIWLAGMYIWVPHYWWDSASVGAKTTVLDLSHFLIMHMNGGVYEGTRILNESSVKEMHRVQYPGSYDGGFSHGFGWYSKNYSDGDTYGGHDGNLPGYKAVMQMRYSDKVGVIFFYNRFQPATRSTKHELIVDIKNFARNQIEKELFKKADEL